ncbi:ferritin-like catalase Nec2 [Rosa sericea]
MARSISHFLSTAFLVLVALDLCLVREVISQSPNCLPLPNVNDTDRLQFALNLEFLEAEFFLFGALGRGLDSISPNLAGGGPPPSSAQKALLNPVVARIIEEFGYQQVGHIRAIIDAVGGIPRPLLNISRENFARGFNGIVGFNLIPPFNPYANTINFLLAAYSIPYIGIGGYVGRIRNLTTVADRALAASLLGVVAGQDAVIRTLLYTRANQLVPPYPLTVAEFTNRISTRRNFFGGCGNKDEGILLPNNTLGAENRTTSNILSADFNSGSYTRTPAEILRIVYGGNESVAGGFFPQGANGNIAMRYLNNGTASSIV